MSLFDFPRINVTGTLKLNPGTANNDDYAGYATFPEGSGPNTGQTLALIDSKLVEPRTYGMSDADFIAWVQKAQTFDTPKGKQQIIPSEWNYYGGMNSKALSGSVIGVTTAPGQVYTSPDSGIPVTALIGATLAFSGTITDVNSEGNPPATQFFIDTLTLTQGSETWLSGSASKASSQWLNFYRNANLTQDAGSGGYVYHVMLKSSGATINIPGFDDPSIVGVIFRYYLYNSTQTTQGNAAIEALYQQQQANSAVIQFVATFAPLYEEETIVSAPVGRLMVADKPTITTPQGTVNNGGNGGPIALGPAVLSVDGNTISAEFAGTFPDYYQSGNNPKLDFGAVSLKVTNGTDSATVAAVNYSDTDAGNQAGWLFDFDISSNPQAQQILAGGTGEGGTGESAVFELESASYGVVLAETAYYFVSNQQAVYGEQHGSGTEFVNQGSPEPVTVSVFQHGQQLTSCPPITVWQYASVPLQAPGDAVAINTNYQPGQPISIDTSQPGNFLLTFTVEGQAPPAPSYSAFAGPPYVTNWPQISLRILPNEDFSRYFVDPAAADPVGNDQLTFDVVYQKVLRTYYLLYPVMKQYVVLNDESSVAGNAAQILDDISAAPANWLSSSYMPRTRDMSTSRRTLLQAWCRAVSSKAAV
ncbi:MAG: hypothetical protein ABUT39_27460 [Acidobacteriota bacterium]